ncbi:unnamed protein product [Linum trigynum]|uniref:Germin-like protein n=1 Tax=Linum trigynum TaxID=586398 RepID=A0AAV2CKL0_9ROSI
MRGGYFHATCTFFALASLLASGDDFTPQVDFCVAINNPNGNGAYFSNGELCKNAEAAKAEDFYFSGLDATRETDNRVGSTITLLSTNQIPGLDGLSLARTDYAPNGGLNPPHIHPHATEILTLLRGILHVGFITSSPENRLITKTLHPGDVFVFPIGLIHYQLNTANNSALAINSFSSKNPGVITIANAIFGSHPPHNREILAKAFQLNTDTINFLQQRFKGNQ